MAERWKSPKKVAEIYLIRGVYHSEPGTPQYIMDPPSGLKNMTCFGSLGYLKTH